MALTAAPECESTPEPGIMVNGACSPREKFHIHIDEKRIRIRIVSGFILMI